MKLYSKTNLKFFIFHLSICKDCSMKEVKSISAMT